MAHGSPVSTGPTQVRSRSAIDVSRRESAPETASAFPWRRMQHLKLLVLFTIVSTMLGTTLFYLFPGLPWLFGEDKAIENLSVLFYVLAFIVATFRCTTSWQSDDRLGWLPGVAALGAVGALEELSYGQRVFEFSVYTVGGVELDAAHDFANIAYEALKHGYAANAALTITVSAGFVVLLGYFVVRYASRTISIVKGSQPLLILSFLVFLLAAAVLIDLEIVRYRLNFLRVFEEIFELNAALAVFLLSLVVNNSVREE